MIASFTWEVSFSFKVGSHILILIPSSPSHLHTDSLRTETFLTVERLGSHTLPQVQDKTPSMAAVASSRYVCEASTGNAALRRDVDVPKVIGTLALWPMTCVGASLNRP